MSILENPGTRTFQGRSVEELLPQIRAELGPDAVIVRQREGLVGGVAGFFAQRMVEVEARPGGGVDIYDDEDDADFDAQLHQALRLDGDPAAGLTGPATGDLGALLSELVGGSAERPAVPAWPAAPPRPVFPPLPEGVPADLPAPFPTGFEAGAARTAGEAAPELNISMKLDAALIAAALAEPEPEPVAPELAAPEPAAAEVVLAPAEPLAESTDGENGRSSDKNQRFSSSVEPGLIIPDEIAALISDADPVELPEPAAAPVIKRARAAAPKPARRPKVRRPRRSRSGTEAPAFPFSGTEVEALLSELSARGASPAWVRELIEAAAAHGLCTDLREAVRQELVRRLPATPLLPASGARIAFVGAGGAGKTTLTLALAGLYSRRSSLPVTVAALDSGQARKLRARLSAERADVITLRPEDEPESGAVTILDTPALSPSEPEAVAALAAVLRQLACDAVYLVIPATVSPVAARQLLQAFSALLPSGLVLTHADETDQHAVVIELAAGAGLPVPYVLGGADPASDLSLPTPARLAQLLLP